MNGIYRIYHFVIVFFVICACILLYYYCEVFCQPEIVTSYYARFAEPRVSTRHQYEADTWRHEADFAAVVGGCCSWHRC